MRPARRTLCHESNDDGARRSPFSVSWLVTLTVVLQTTPSIHAAGPMTSTLQVSISATQSVPLGAPVPAQLTLVNTGTTPVAVLLPYPNPNNLRIACLTPDVATPKTVEPQEIERAAPLTIAPGQRLDQTHYLNRYCAFKQAGRARFAYALSATAGPAPGGWKTPTTAGQVRFQGEFEVTLTEPSGTSLTDALDHYRRQLQQPERQRRIEAAEALAFLDTPASVPYIASLLEVENLEITGIEALGRHPMPDSARAIARMLGHRESGVVEAALATLDRMGVPPARAQVQALLRAENDHIRWVALDWLSRRPDKQDLPLLSVVVRDANEAVRTSAQRYAQALQMRP